MSRLLSAVSRVILTPELLEKILLHVLEPPHGVVSILGGRKPGISNNYSMFMGTYRRVSQTWKELIDTSPKIRQGCWRITPSFRPRVSGEIYTFCYPFLDWLLDRIGGTVYGMDDARWYRFRARHIHNGGKIYYLGQILDTAVKENLFMTSPPVSELGVIIEHSIDPEIFPSYFSTPKSQSSNVQLVASSVFDNEPSYPSRSEAKATFLFKYENGVTVADFLSGFQHIISTIAPPCGFGSAFPSLTIGIPRKGPKATGGYQDLSPWVHLDFSVPKVERYTLGVSSRQFDRC